MSFIGVVLTVLFIIFALKLVKFFISFQIAVRSNRQQYEDDRKTLGGVLLIALLLIFAYSGDSNGG